MILLFTFAIPVMATITNFSNTSFTNGTYQISIDPIGNHTIGEVFFINGTTNLPVSENLTLGMEALSYIMRPHQKTDTGPGPHRSANLPALPISPALPGLNRWSANVTDIVKELESGEYEVSVFPPLNGSCNTLGCNIPKAEADQIFTLFPANNNTTLSVSLTTVQTPSSIQPKISATTLTASTPVSPNPTKSPGYDALVTVISLFAIALVIVRKH
jgi:hypothetical protein